MAVRCAPDRDVDRGFLGRVVDVLAEFGEGRKHLGMAETGRGDGDGATEIDRAVDLVRGSPIEQGCRQAHDAADVLMRTRLVIGAAHAQVRHVVIEVVLMDRRELVVRRTGLARGFGEHVVDIGDVACDDRRDVGMAQGADECIDPHESRGMAEMGHVVRGDPARVDASRPDQGQGLPAEDEWRGRQQVVTHAESLRRCGTRPRMADRRRHCAHGDEQPDEHQDGEAEQSDRLDDAAAEDSA